MKVSGPVGSRESGLGAGWRAGASSSAFSLSLSPSPSSKDSGLKKPLGRWIIESRKGGLAVTVWGGVCCTWGGEEKLLEKGTSQLGLDGQWWAWAGGEGCEGAVGTEPNAQEGRSPGHVACGREGPHMKGGHAGSSRR